MRKRTKQVNFRLSEEEYGHLKKQVQHSGLSREGFLRSLIAGVTLRPKPPDQYAALLREMSAIGNNVNQIARVANAAGYARRDEIAQITEMQRTLWTMVKEL